MNKPINIIIDMTPTQALMLAEDISLVVNSLRDDIATVGEIPKETHYILMGTLGLIAHSARTLTEFMDNLVAQGGGDYE